MFKTVLKTERNMNSKRMKRKQLHFLFSKAIASVDSENG